MSNFKPQDIGFYNLFCDLLLFCIGKQNGNIVCIVD
jgi:hypothetical protein